MKNWKWWAFLLVGTSFCLCAPTAFAAENAGLHTQLPGAELWQPYLDQSPVDALQVAEDPWSVLQSFCTSSLFQTLRESIRGYAALLLFLLLSAIVSLFLGEEGDHSWCDLVCAVCKSLAPVCIDCCTVKDALYCIFVIYAPVH